MSRFPLPDNPTRYNAIERRAFYALTYGDLIKINKPFTGKTRRIMPGEMFRFLSVHTDYVLRVEHIDSGKKYKILIRKFIDDNSATYITVWEAIECLWNKTK
jgi:hypothetical protein